MTVSRPFSRTTRTSLGAMTLGAALVLGACGGGSSGDGGLAADDDMPPDGAPLSPGEPSVGEEMPPVVDAGEPMPPNALPSDDEGSCSTADQNEWVYDNMLDYYLFYDQVPVVEPGDFASPRALLREIRFEERDPFSFIAPATESDLEFEEGREFGLGYRWGEEFDGSARVISVILDSPFGRAGIERGDVIVEINGSPALEVLNDRARFGTEVFGTREAPVESTWTFAERDGGERFTARFTATEYRIDTVRHVDVFTDPAYDGAIGYFLFERFLETSSAELETVFEAFREAGVTDLVLDLRNNGGGRISIAQELATRVLDDSRAGAPLQRYRFNDKYQDENFELPILEDLAGLGLRTLVVLGTQDTASSSEIVAGGLAPFMDVRLIGPERTSGKPYIQRGRDRCDQRLNAVEAEALNADRASVFGGIAPDCHAFDDWREGYGRDAETDEIEGMLLAGLDLLLTGACEPFVEDGARSRGARRTAASGQGTTPTGGALLDAP